MVALFIVTILHTYSNLAGLIVQVFDTQPSFVGEDAEVTLKVERSGKRWVENVNLRWPAGNMVSVSLLEKAEVRVRLFVRVLERGWLNPGRLRIESQFPLGLFFAWSLVDLDVRLLVYPKPVPAGPIPPAIGSAEDGILKSQRGGDDFEGYKAYQAGHSLKHVDWKHYARGQSLQTKQYASDVDQQCWLEGDHFAGLDREARLSRLCDWVLTISKTETEYGLRLPSVEIKPAKGLAHKQQVLTALALFEWEQLQHAKGGV